MSTRYTPTFLSKNAIASVAELAITTGTGDNTANKSRLIDRNEDIRLSSTISAGGIIIRWSPAATTTVDTVILQNCNFRIVSILWSGAGGYRGQNFIDDSGDSNNAYLPITSTTVTAGQYLEIQIATVTGATVCNCGQLYIGTKTFSMAETYGGEVFISPRTQQNIITLADGSSQKIYVRKMYDYSLDLVNVPTIERTSFLAVYNANKRNTFFFVPEPIDAPTFIAGTLWAGIGGHVNWVNTFEFANRTNLIEANGYDAHIELAQSGGAT